MRRFLAILLFALAALSVSGIAAQQETPPPGALQVVDTSPLAGEELGLNDSITVYFDHLVDCATAQTALSIRPSVEGEVTCSAGEASVTFTPSEAFARATTYTVALNPGLRGEDGSRLAESYALELNTAGFLTVTEVLPAPDSEGVETGSVITVIFNRPVVPLVIAEDMGDLPNPITITPSVEGQGEWLNTSIYTFRPDPALAGGTDYNVTVNMGLQAQDGSVLPEAYTWSFRTVEPALLEVYPELLSSDVRLAESVQVTFNQPMNRASVEAGFRLFEGDVGGEPVSGAFEWNEDDSGFMFTPDEPLQLDTVYEAVLSPDVEAAGGAVLGANTEWVYVTSFATVPYPAIVGTDPFDGQTGVYPHTSFNIYFASPMNVETLKDKITIEPEPWREPDFYYSTWDNSYTVSFPTEPSTDYTITIAPGMEDIYGNPIEGRLVVSYTTSAYDPDVVLHVPGPVGFYNANNEATQLFLTHRNVDRIDLSLYDVSADEFRALLAGGGYYLTDDYIPNSDDLLRRWSIGTEDTPLNQMRYELLDLGQPGNNPSASCEGAPESRLKVGDAAVVITEPDPLRARASAPDGEIVARLYADYSLSIVGGPTCADGFLWWEVALRDGQTAWVAEGDLNEYYLDVRVAAETTPVVVESEDGGALPPGVYYLEADAPELSDNGRHPQKHFLVVSTANLTLKLSIDSVFVWATDVNTGEPIAGAPITVYDNDGEAVGSGVTDADGFVRVETPRVDDIYTQRVAVLQDGAHFGVTAAQWSDGIDPYNFGQNYTSRPEEWRTYLYTDRPIYRPGQPVYFRGVIRQKDDVTYTPPDFATVPVQITTGEGDIVYERLLEVTPFGTFSGQFDIADDAPLGYYSIVATMPGQEEDYYYYGDSGRIGFFVAEYRAPEFQVNLTPEQSEVVQNDTIRVLVDSRYFFGGVVSDATVEWRAVNAPFYFDYSGRGRYSFVDFDYDSGPGEYYFYGGEELASGVGTTDASGQFVIELDADLKDSTQSQVFTVEATVSDESGQAVSARADVTVHTGLVYVGVGPEDYVGFEGEETTVNFITVDWDSNPVPDQPVDVTVVERRWSSVQEMDEAGRATWTWEVEEIPVTDAELTTDENGQASFAFTPPNGGIFKITATTRDEQGNRVVAADTIWVSSSEYVSWRQQNSNRIDLIADSTSYEVGDTAQILITSPFQGSAEALVTVERGDVLTAERITLASNSYVYELPITADFAPNVYVGVVIVKGVDENNPVAGFRMGMIGLGVNNEQKQLTITVAPDREQAGPQETVTYTVNVTDYAGDPVVAEVGVGLTDLATLSIAEPNSGPLLDFYYGQQAVSVRTATPLTINTDQLTQTVLDTIKGGGGGFGEGGIFDIREEFVDTPYWNATLVTDDNGEASFSVTLPDNLTTWRLDARAVTGGEDGLTLVGQTTFDLLSTKPLLIRPVTPRFFIVGDTVMLAAIVNNNTDAEQRVEVTLQAAGVAFDQSATQTITIPAGTRQRVNWMVTVDDVESVDLTFFANGNDGEYTDASKPPLGQGDARLLPVYRYEAPETVGTGGVLREAETITEAVALPQRFDVTQGELDVSLQSSLAGSTLESLDYLRNYPYQCIEQTVSRFLPNIMTYRALAELGVANAELEQNLNEAVQFALQRLYAQQHVDGGWGWFVRDRSNPLTTAYALIGLAEAREQGFAVSNDVIANAQHYLRSTFVTPSLSQPTWRLNRQAFTLYALARSGAPDVARTSTLYDSRARLSYYARAFLALALNIIDPSDTSRTDVLMSDLMNGAILSATGAHWEEAERDYWNWNTDTRTTAIVLDALIALRPDSDLLPNAVRYLMVQRQADSWETTQETAWAVMALTDWMSVSGELTPGYSYSVELNGEALTSGTATPDNIMESVDLRVQVADLLVDEANYLAITRSEGDGVLYYTSHLRVFLPVPEIEPLNRGIIIERRYTIGADETPVTQAYVGQNVQVRLTVIVPNELHYVVIEDPIPAGTDAVNPELETSQQIGTQPELNLQDPLSRGWGWWYFSNVEFHDEKVVLFSTYLPAGTYEYVYTIRAGLEGTYNVIPPTGYEFYFPEVYGRGAGSTFTITGAPEVS